MLPFLKFPFSFCENELKPKQIRLPFSEKFLWKLHCHIFHSTKTNVALKTVNLGTEIEHP